MVNTQLVVKTLSVMCICLVKFKFRLGRVYSIIMDIIFLQLTRNRIFTHTLTIKKCDFIKILHYNILWKCSGMYVNKKNQYGSYIQYGLK